MQIGPLETGVLLVVFVVVMILMSRGRQPSVASNLEAIFGERSLTGPGHEARLWALATLFDAGVDSDSDPVYAMKVLRDAEPRLTLSSAKALVDSLNNP